MAKKYFTLAEANALLPKIEAMLRNLQEAKREMQIRYRKLQESKLSLLETEESTDDLFFQEEAELEFAIFNANLILKQLQDTGVQVKDIDSGLCDFLTMLHGQEVLLCWRLGEDEVGHWHGTNEGYINRRPIEIESDFEDLW